MGVQELFATLGERLSATANVKNVYGDPVTVGDRTVIPVASVRYAMSGGAKGDPQKSAGGGGVVAKPCGALEITPEGTRFVPLIAWKTAGIAFALGVVMGVAMASLGRTKRIEVLKRTAGTNATRPV